jgi:hypothetical protein
MRPSSGLPISYVSLESLYHAYRKAKVDVCTDKNQPRARAFVEFEVDLYANLLRLQERLTEPETNWFSDPAFIGTCGCVPKSWEITPVDTKSDYSVMEPHFFVSDPETAWERKLDSGDFTVKVEFRPMALFSVDMHIVSALWVNLIGHFFDGCLSEHAAGARVRRLKIPINGSRVGQYHIESLGTFPPYFTAYKKWRDDGMQAIRRELTEGRGVVAVTMDLTSFYHNIDASFLLNEEFLTSGIRFREVYGRSLTDEEALFTQQLIKSFETWSKSKPDFDESRPVGIPVGPSAPRIIANALLAEFDRAIVEELEPIYYSRYVDDIFLVLRDSGKYKKGSDVFNRLEKLLDGKVKVSGSDITLDLPYAKSSCLKFQAKKQRIFLLKGEAGEDLLDTIKDRIDEVSSEWRLLPDLDELEKSPAAKVLSSSRIPSEEANTLRKADDLSLNRLSFSILLRFYNQLQRDLPSKEWKKERNSFFRFAERNVLSPPKIFDLSNYIPSLISLAVACRDWRSALRLLRRVKRSFESIESHTSSGNESQWNCFKLLLSLSIEQAVVTSFPISGVSVDDEKQCGKLIEETLGFGGRDIPDELPSFRLRAQEYFWTDLSRVPFKDAMLGLCDFPPFPFGDWEGELSEIENSRLRTIQTFLPEFSSPNTVGRERPLLFPTRPFSVSEITEVDQKCVTDMDRLHDLAWALRGAWLKPLDQEESSDKFAPLTIGKKQKLAKPRIALTSHSVSDASWSCAAAGKPNLGTKRYTALVKLTNAILKSSVKPDYVLFPELSIPRKWLPSVSRKLKSAGISMIAGVEYERISIGTPSKTYVTNEAYLYLMDDRFGYREQCVVKQRKGFAAYHEREELRHKFGLEVAPLDPAKCEKRVINHFGHCFGLLICSELTDIRFREKFRGNIDSLFILSWNQDLESFAALVDSASLDLHCFVSLVNNRRFGDSRVRVPYKKQWRRDLVRVKGGLEDYFVTTELDLTELRQFQSHAEPPLGELAAFKPFPEGFLISDNRKEVPGSPS